MSFDSSIIEDGRPIQLGYGQYVYSFLDIPSATMTASLVNYITVFTGRCTQKTWNIKSLTGGGTATIEVWGDPNPERTLAQVETHDADLLSPQNLTVTTLAAGSEIEYQTSATYAWMTFRASGNTADVRAWFSGL